jgi:hypothetical protein
MLMAISHANIRIQKIAKYGQEAKIYLPLYPYFAIYQDI